MNEKLQDIKTMLWESLDEAGMLPGHDLFARSSSSIQQKGFGVYETICHSLRTANGKLAIKRLKTELSEAHIARVLGFGYKLTEFMIAPLQVRTQEQDSIAATGALANLIITLFDYFADKDETGNWSLPRHLLSGSAKGSRSSLLDRFFMRHDKLLLKVLIRLYYQRIAQLQDPPKPELSECLQQSICNMYGAEISTVGKKQVAPLVWRRKSALPFLVMGLPGWYAAGCETGMHRWHMRWMYQLGIFFGGVDDAVDLIADIKAGSFNHLHDGNTDPACFCKQQAQLAVRLLAEWKQFVPVNIAADELLANLVPVTICSWFGGTYWKR